MSYKCLAAALLSICVAFAGKLSPVFDSMGDNPRWAAVVELLPAVTTSAAEATMRAEGLDVRHHPDLGAHRVLVVGPQAGIKRLERFYEVSHIFPASDTLLNGEHTVACPGPPEPPGSPGLFLAPEGAGWSALNVEPVVIGVQYGTPSPLVDMTAAKAAIQRALQEWSRYVQLDFILTTDDQRPRTLTISFLPDDHGDGFPFGAALAHAFYPNPRTQEPLAGDVHVKDSSAAAGDLFSVLLHEIGHALGLMHSDNPTAVMYPYYKKWQKLEADDISGIRRLYPAKSQRSALSRTQR